MNIKEKQDNIRESFKHWVEMIKSVYSADVFVVNGRLLFMEKKAKKKKDVPAKEPEEIIELNNEVAKMDSVELETSAEYSEELAADIPEKEEIVEKPKKEKINPVANIIIQIKKNIEAAQKKADDIHIGLSGAYTAKRQREADHRQKTKDKLQGRIQMLNNLLVDYDIFGSVHETLSKIRTVGDIEYFEHAVFPSEPDAETSEWLAKEYPTKKAKFDKFGITTPVLLSTMQQKIQELSEIKLSESEIQQRELTEKIKSIQGAKIPGFFPTPDILIDSMIDLANISDKDSILEPSCGMGSIIDRIRDRGYENLIWGVEQQYTLAEICKLKGHSVEQGDIFASPQDGDGAVLDVFGMAFNRILMNPPFEKREDIAHVIHCFTNYLADKGVLVSVMSASVLNGTHKKQVAFREFVKEYGEFVPVPPGMFIDSFNPTGVATTLVVLNKENDGFLSRDYYNVLVG